MPKPSERYEEIDTMRGIAIIAMIVIHTAAYYPRDPNIYALWDLLEFAVPIFIFCSAYLFFKQEYHHHIGHTVGYFKKRLVRLLKPYYIFLLLYLPLMAYAEPKKVTQKSIIDNIFLTGGVDFNWMVLLFLELSFIMPLLLYLFMKKRPLFIAYALISGASTVLFLFMYPNAHYRAIMILPWSLLIIFSWVVAQVEKHSKNMTALFVASIFLYTVSRAAIIIQSGPLDHFHNKYPPNLYHLSYGFFSIIGLFFLSHILRRSHGHIRSAISFFSKYSYSIYFIHIYILYLITVVGKSGNDTRTFGVFFLEVFVTTALVQLAFNRINRAISASQR